MDRKAAVRKLVKRINRLHYKIPRAEAMELRVPFMQREDAYEVGRTVSELVRHGVVEWRMIANPTWIGYILGFLVTGRNPR